VSYQQNGHRVEHETDDPTELLHRLTGEALARGERLEGLSVTRPSLEDVYLELTAEADSESA
jgi:ABC-2 type transport system ATP-binding protein